MGRISDAAFTSNQAVTLEPVIVVSSKGSMEYGDIKCKIV